MKKLMIAVIAGVFIACGSQKMAKKSASSTHSNEKTKDTRHHGHKESPLLAQGNIALEEVRNQSWYARSYNSYNPDAEMLGKFSKALKKHDYNIDVYFGTWCGDSRRVVPKFIKLLEKTNFDFSRLTFVSVNHSKQVPNVSPETEQKLNIHHVPTIIFYENGAEVERFVESSQVSLAADMVTIVSREKYVDSYGG